MLKILAGVSMIALVAPAFSQKVYDNNNAMIGPLVSTAGPVVSGPGLGLAITKLNGEYHFLLVSALGVHSGNRIMYYQPVNCQGSPFLSYNPSNDILPLAFFDSQTIWAIDARQAGNYSMKSAKVNQTCHTFSSTILNIAPAVPTTVRFLGPLSVR
jgi:hypothetical protein